MSLDKAGSLPFTLYAASSKAIGLDMTAYAGKQVGLLKVRLKDRSQGGGGGASKPTSLSTMTRSSAHT